MIICIRRAFEAKDSFGDIVKISIEVEYQIRNINNEIKIMLEGIKKVEEMNKTIFETANQSARGSQEVAASIEEQTANLQEILSSSSELSDMAAKLQSTIQKFIL